MAPRNVVMIILVLLCIFHDTESVESIRLSGGSYDYEGRVEVRVNGEWGTVCIDNFGDDDAKVICRQLNFTGGKAETSGTFGPGNGPIWLDNLGCNGIETSLTYCQANNLGVHDCDHSDDAGVQCDPPTAQTQAASLSRAPAVAQPNICAGNTDPNIRLVGPNNTVGVGFVEVKFNNVWGAVCDDHWDIAAARVVCGSLCFNKSLSLTGTTHDIDYVKDNVSTSFLLDDVQCIGSELEIFSCNHSGIGVHNCLPGEYASVTCTHIQHNTETAPEPELSCNNEKFTVRFNRQYDPNLTYGGLRVDRPTGSTSECNITYSNTTNHVIMEIPFTDCDTAVSSNASHIFYNITLVYSPNSDGIITRKSLYYVTLTCEFPKNNTNQVDYNAQPSQVGVSSRGEFFVNMILYKDDHFNVTLSTTPTLEMDIPVTVALHLNATLPHLKLVVRSCFATSSGSLTDNLRYYLFRDNCAEDITLALIPINDTSSGFRFNSFKFVSSPNVYLHCYSLVCELDEKDSLCDRSCHKTVINRRRRRSDRKERSPKYTELYTTSQQLIIRKEVEGPIIERYPTTEKAVTRTIITTSSTAPPSVSMAQNTNHESTTAVPATPTFTTRQPSSSSVKVVSAATMPTSGPTEMPLKTKEVKEVFVEETFVDEIMVDDVSAATHVRTPLVTMTIALLGLVSFGYN